MLYISEVLIKFEVCMYIRVSILFIDFTITGARSWRKPRLKAGHFTRSNFCLQLATNVALQVARKISRVTPHFATVIVALRVARKVERPSTFRNVSRQVANVWHPLCNLKGFFSLSLRCKLQEKLPRVTWPSTLWKFVWWYQRLLIAQLGPVNQSRIIYLTLKRHHCWTELKES